MGLWDLVWHQFTTRHDTHVVCPDCRGRGCGRCGLRGVVCPWREKRASVVRHLRLWYPGARFRVTDCCGRPLDELGPDERTTSLLFRVTCPRFRRPE